MDQYPPQLIQERASPFIALVSEGHAVVDLAEKLSSSGTLPSGAVQHTYRIFKSDHGFPPCKGPANARDKNYSSYRVGGIIQSNWLEKHHYQLPGLAVLVTPVDTTVGEDEWQAWQDHTAAKIRQLRVNGLQDREIAVGVILLDAESVTQNDVSSQRRAQVDLRMEG